MSQSREQLTETLWRVVFAALSDARTLHNPHDPAIESYWKERILAALDGAGGRQDEERYIVLSDHSYDGLGQPPDADGGDDDPIPSFASRDEAVKHAKALGLISPKGKRNDAEILAIQVPAVDKDREDELTELLLGFASVSYSPDVDYHPDVKDSARMAAQRFLASGGSGGLEGRLNRIRAAVLSDPLLREGGRRPPVNQNVESGGSEHG